MAKQREKSKQSKQREKSKQSEPTDVAENGLLAPEKSTASPAWNAYQEYIEFMSSEDAPGKWDTVWSDAVAKKNELKAKYQLMSSAEATLTPEQKKLPPNERKKAILDNISKSGMFSKAMVDTIGEEWMGYEAPEVASEAEQLLAGAKISSEMSVYDILSQPLEQRTGISTAQVIQDIGEVKNEIVTPPSFQAQPDAVGIVEPDQPEQTDLSTIEEDSAIPTTPAAEAASGNSAGHPASTGFQGFHKDWEDFKKDYMQVGKTSDGRTIYAPRGRKSTKDNVIYGSKD